MIDKKLPLEDEVNAVAMQVDGYKVMLASRGWKDLQSEIDFHVAEQQDLLQDPKINLEMVRFHQGQIAAFRWLMGHFDEVAEHLEEIQKALRSQKDETKAGTTA